MTTVRHGLSALTNFGRGLVKMRGLAVVRVRRLVPVAVGAVVLGVFGVSVADAATGSGASPDATDLTTVGTSWTR